MSSLVKAFANSERSYLACKASVSQIQSDILSNGPTGGGLIQRPDLAQAPEQLRHFTGWSYAAIRAIAQKVAGQKIHVGRKASNPRPTKAQPTDFEPFDTHPLIDLLNDPNDLMVAWSLIYTTVASMQLTGRALWWLPNKEQILPIPISWIRGFEGSSSFEAFRVSPPHVAEEYPLPAEECCYFSFPSPSDPHGAVSPLQAAAQAVDADESIQKSQAIAFRRGMHPTHAIIVGKANKDGARPTLSPKQQRQIVSLIHRRYAGVYNANEPLILDSLIEDVKQLTHSPAEMNWLESSQLTKERILQGFGVNETIIGSKEANRASATAADKHFIDFTINPLIELMSQTLTEWLAPMFGGEIVVWIDPAVSNDAEMQHKWAVSAARFGCVTVDEFREMMPFDLEIGKYPDLISTSGKSPAEEAALESLDKTLQAATKAISEPVEFSMPNPADAASRIVEAAGPRFHLNGHQEKR